MKEGRNKFILGIMILSLICSLYVLYRTVFDQIISQSQGYFYAGVFGFILLLVFLLCNLFTKLIATSVKEQDTIAWKIGAAITLAVIGAIFFYTRTSTINSVEAWDSAIYKSANAMISGRYALNKDLILSNIQNPTQYVYSFLIYKLFTIFGVSSQVIVKANIVILIFSFVLLYNITLVLSDRFSALFAVLIAFIMPATTFAVYSYSENSFFTLIFLLNVYLFLKLYLSKFEDKDKAEEDNKEAESKNEASTTNKNEENTNIVEADSVEKSLLPETKDKEKDNKDSKSNSVKDKKAAISIKDIINQFEIEVYLYSFLFAMSTGLLLLCEPVAVFPLLLLILLSFLLKKDISFNLLISLAAGIFLFVILMFAKSVHMDEDFGTVISGQAECFDFFDEVASGHSLSFKEVIKRFNSEIAVINDDILDNYKDLSNKKGEVSYTQQQIELVVVVNQLIYMFLLVMFLSCISIAYKEKKDEVIPLLLVFVGTIIMIFFSQNRVIVKLYYIDILLAILGVSIHYLYLNHHPEQKPIVSAIDALASSETGSYEYQFLNRMNNPFNDNEFVKRAEALIFVGTDEELYTYIKDEERKQAISEGKMRPLDDTFDDYDEDYFLDSEEKQDVKVSDVSTDSNDSLKSSASDKPAPIVDIDNKYEESSLEVANIKKNLDELSKQFSEQYNTEVVESNNIMFSNEELTSNQSDYTSIDFVNPWEVRPPVENTLANTLGEEALYEENPSDSVSLEETKEEELSYSFINEIEPMPEMEEEEYTNDLITVDNISVDENLDKDEKKKSGFSLFKSKKSTDKPDKKSKSKGNKIEKAEVNKTGKRIKNISGSTKEDEEIKAYLSEKEKNNKYISNPLPVPEKKGPKAVGFAIENSTSGWEWDYDIEVNPDDDF